MDPKHRIKLLIERSQVKVPDMPIKQYFRSGRETLRQAIIYAEEDDTERAFLLFHRFAS